MYIDLSHDFEHNMPGFKLTNEDGTNTQYTAKISPFLTHKQTIPKFNGNVSFEITQIEFQSSVGTYLDAPYHRYPDMRDISQLKIEELIRDGIVIDVRNRDPWEEVGPDILEENDINKSQLDQKAVLFNFGWDKYWGMEQYHSYPFISKELIEILVDANIAILGVDTINSDNSKDPTRPAHSLLLKNEIFIVENLCNLDKLHGKDFKFYAVPIKGVKVAAMPIRAFAYSTS